jgi:hypothetical protein
MQRTALLALTALPLLAGCPSDAKNPAKLWLFLDGSETEIILVDYEPEPY